MLQIHTVQLFTYISYLDVRRTIKSVFYVCLSYSCSTKYISVTCWFVLTAPYSKLQREIWKPIERSRQGTGRAGRAGFLFCCKSPTSCVCWYNECTDQHFNLTKTSFWHLTLALCIMLFLGNTWAISTKNAYDTNALVLIKKTIIVTKCCYLNSPKQFRCEMAEHSNAKEIQLVSL